MIRTLIASLHAKGVTDDDDDEDPICNETGICRPEETDEGVSNCIHCGKELIQVGDEWKTWDFDLFLE